MSDAALPQFDPLVVPGLVTLLGLTAIGAFMGYRQAKAGPLPDLCANAVPAVTRYPRLTMTRLRGGGEMSVGRRVTKAVNGVLVLAPREGEVSLTRLVAAVGEDRGRPIDVSMAELPRCFRSVAPVRRPR